MGDVAERASRAWASLEAACIRADGDGRLVLLDGPRGDRAPVWPYGQALAAAIDLDRLAGEHAEASRWVDGLAAYARGDGYAPAPRSRRRYFDDNAWIGLALAQLHVQGVRPGLLEHARRVFAFVRTGADPDGGVRWVEGRGTRNACATAPAAQLAMWLYGLEGKAEELAFARRAMSWLERTLMLPGGLVADHEERGRVDDAVWSYNQGTALGAWTRLHRTAAQDGALDRATALAEASLRRFRGDALWSHPPIFNAIWFRNLLALHAVRPVPGLLDRLDGYLDRVWKEARDPRSGLFTARDIGSYDGTPTVDHAGLTQLFALRAWPMAAWGDIA